MIFKSALAFPDIIHLPILKWSTIKSNPPPPAPGVIQQWTELKTAAMELQQRADGLSRLQDRIRSFRHGLVTLDEQTTRAGRDVPTIDHFEERISAVKVR